jgi:hypothetical protein
MESRQCCGPINISLRVTFHPIKTPSKPQPAAVEKLLLSLPGTPTFYSRSREGMFLLVLTFFRYFIAQDAEEVKRVVNYCKVRNEAVKLVVFSLSKK